MKSNQIRPSRKNVFSLILTITVLLFYSCNKDSEYGIKEEGSVQFLFNTTQTNVLKSTDNSGELAVSSIVISVEDACGEKVFTLKQIQIFQIGDKYITEPVSFEVGEYKITDFLVSNEEGIVIYATPKEGSPYEGAVDDALAITFVVTTNNIQNVSPQVIETINIAPIKFGYSTFSFDIVETKNFLISVFAFDDNNKTISVEEPNLTVTSENKVLYSGLLSSVTNAIAIPVSYETYTVEVNKNGYKEYSETFTKEELMDYTQPDGQPLVVVLKTKGRLIFWNKLGSIDEIQNSEVGPGILLTNYKVTDWEQAQIIPGKFGKGLFVNNDTREGWMNDGGNFFAIDNHSVGLTTERGCIEFWFIFKYDCNTNNHAFFLTTCDSLTGHFTTCPKSSNIGMTLGWNGWDYGSFGKSYFLNFVNSYSYEETSYTEKNSAAPGGDLEFIKGQLVHFGFSWDKDGIDGTSETMQIYVDGIKVSAKTAELRQTESLQNYLYIGTRPSWNPWDHYYNAVKGVIDNLKIWNYAKTDYSDRFNE
jgi:hypothetical protein